jgi:hypothetical protein
MGTNRTMSELRFDFDQAVWIGVPIDWRDVPDGTPRGWANWVVDTLAEEEPGSPEDVEALKNTLALIGESQSPEENRFVFLPETWSAPSMISVRAAVSQRDVPLTEIAGVGAEGTVEHYEEGITTKLLGTGIRSLRYSVESDGVIATLVYAFRAKKVDVRIAASDYDLTRMALMQPYVDEFARAISVH